MEFPIVSLFISLLSSMKGNGSISINSVSIHKNATLPTSETQVHVAKYIAQHGRPKGSVTGNPGLSRTTTTTTSAPIPDISNLCPHQDPYKTRYHAATRRCYTVPSQGPCGENMAFYARDDVFGECGCKSDSRLLIYNSKEDKCFYIFQQGYCGALQWIDIKRNGTPICTPSPCALMARITKKDLVKFDGRCVQVGKRANGCKVDEVIGFQPLRRSPKCISTSTPIEVPSSRAIGVPSTPCNLGSMRALIGGCSPPFDFD